MNTYLRAFYKPTAAFRELLEKKNYFALGFLYILLPITGYTLLYIFLTIAKGAPSVFTPWLNISKESYYSVNRFLLAPSMLLCWFTATSVIQILSRLFKGSGSFEQTLAVLALCISIAMWASLIHDLPMSFLSASGVIDARQHEIAMNSPTIYRTLLWIAYSAYLVAFLILFPLAVRVVHKLSLIKSIIIGCFGFIIFQLIFLIFNR
jgi:Yip1 domain